MSEIRGYKQSSFKKMAARLDAQMPNRIYKSYALRIWSLINERNVFSFFIYEPASCDFSKVFPITNKDEKNYFSIDKLVNFKKDEAIKKFGEEALSKITKEGYFLELLDGPESKILIPSERFTLAFYKAIGFKCKSGGINPMRDLYVASLLTDTDVDFGFQEKEKDGITYVLSATASHFKQISHVDTFNAIEYIQTKKNATMHSYSFAPEYTEINMIFDDYNNVIHGVQFGFRISYSSTNQYAYSYTEIAYIDNAPLPIGRVASRRQTKRVCAKDLADLYLQKAESQINETISNLKNAKKIKIAKRTLASYLVPVFEKIQVKQSFGMEKSRSLYKEADFDRVKNGQELLLTIAGMLHVGNDTYKKYMFQKAEECCGKALNVIVTESKKTESIEKYLEKR